MESTSLEKEKKRHLSAVLHSFVRHLTPYPLDGDSQPSSDKRGKHLGLEFYSDLRKKFSHALNGVPFAQNEFDQS